MRFGFKHIFLITLIVIGLCLTGGIYITRAFVKPTATAEDENTNYYGYFYYVDEDEDIIVLEIKNNEVHVNTGKVENGELHVIETSEAYEYEIKSETESEITFSLKVFNVLTEEYEDFEVTYLIGEDKIILGEIECNRAEDVEVHECEYLTQVVVPTCTENGYTLHYCEFCGNSYQDNVTQATGHNYINEVVAPTCTENGYTRHTCSKCGDTYTDTIVVATGHNYGEWVVDVEPTYETAGSQHKTCSVCGHVVTESIPVVPYYGTFYYEDEEEDIIVLQISGDEVQLVLAKFENGKLYLLETFDTLDYEITSSDNNEITFNIRMYNEETEEYEDFEVTYLIDEDKIIIFGGVECERVENIETHECEYSTLVIAPTCTENGYTLHYCEFCGNSYQDNVTQATGHDYVAQVVAPTCTTEGYTTHTCSVCGDTYTDTIVSATGHDYVAQVVAPTCTENGYTTYICSHCGDTYTDDVTQAIGHDYGEWVIDTQATCTTNGSKHKTCSHCGDVITETILATGHDYVAQVVAPTCTEDGYTTYTCSHCGDTYTDDITQATGHGVDSDVEVVAPTCEDEGYTLHTCSVCGDTHKDTYTSVLSIPVTNASSFIFDNDTLIGYVGNDTNVNIPSTYSTYTSTESVNGIEIPANKYNSWFGYVSGVSSITFVKDNITKTYTSSQISNLKDNLANDFPNGCFLTNLNGGSYPLSFLSSYSGRVAINGTGFANGKLAYNYWNSNRPLSSVSFSGNATFTNFTNGNDYNVTKISGAFLDNTNLVNVVISTGITSIENGAFKNCSNLVAIILPEGLLEIKGGSFYNCSSLRHITIPSSVTNVYMAFSNDSSLMYFTANGYYTTLDNGKLLVHDDKVVAFASGNSECYVPDSITSIDRQVFINAKKLTNIRLSENLTTLEYQLFSGCSSLENLVIPASVNSIEYAVIGNNCTSLKTITILATTPPTLTTGNFFNSADVIYVPAGCLNAYLNESTWTNSNNYNKFAELSA